MDAILLLRLLYLAASVLVLCVAAVPALRDRFLAYGARSSPSPQTSKTGPAGRDGHDTSGAAVAPLPLDHAAAAQIPHSWFTTFYLVSVVSSAVWLTELLSKGTMFQTICAQTVERQTSMSFQQIEVAWSLMLIQGARRLYESFALSRPSKSTMWIGHWILGILFYLGMGIAIWIEGIPALQSHEYSAEDLALAAPSLRSFVCILVFILASGFQYDCHDYLASLKTKPAPDASHDKDTGYRIPRHPAFHSLVAPHYTAECLIYLSLTLVAAPDGAWANRTILCALLFVVVNLGVTAHTTKTWYEHKFGADSVAGKWRMIPFFF